MALAASGGSTHGGSRRGSRLATRHHSHRNGFAPSRLVLAPPTASWQHVGVDGGVEAVGSAREDLERRLDRWWPEAVQHRPAEFEGRSQPLLPSEVTDLDARSFLKGLDSDPPLLEVRFGYLISCVMAPRRDGTPKENFHLIETNQRGTQLRSETIAHYGSVTELVLDHGWPVDAVVSEPHGSKEVTKGSVDVIVRRGDDVILSVEAKGPQTLLRKLVDGMNRCSGEVSRGHSRSDHNKCLGVLLFRSPYFWGVACGWTRDLYRVEFGQGFVRLTSEPDESVLDG